MEGLAVDQVNLPITIVVTFALTCFSLAFSWREKMLLKIDAKKSKKLQKFESYGPIESVEHLFSEDDVVLDISKVTNEELQAAFPSSVNSKKQIVPSLIFGSHKVSNSTTTESPTRSRTFSHSRIFGKGKVVDVSLNQK